RSYSTMYMSSCVYLCRRASLFFFFSPTATTAIYPLSLHDALPILRIPLLGTSELGLIEFPYAPLELAPFFDAGVAWSSGEEPTFGWARRTPERVPVFSTGISARVNLLGFMVLETYYAYPFQRPDQGWHFGFVISPGW